MEFVAELKRIINSGLSRSIILTGNIYDIFFDGEDYVPVLNLLGTKLKAEPKEDQRGLTHIVYELNNPIEIRGEAAPGSYTGADLHAAWNVIHSPEKKKLADRLLESNGNSTYALELLRQLSEVNRRSSKTRNNLLIMVESADMLIPDCEISRMNMQDRRRVAIVYDWFSDPKFLNNGDTAIFLSESRSSLHHRVARLPQVVSVEIPLPDMESRKAFLKWFAKKKNITGLKYDDIATKTSGLSLHALRQLVLTGEISDEAIAKKVEEYMISQLGEGVVEFKRPKHKMKDVIGNHRIKQFMKNELIPGFLDGEISGAAVGGPIGGGKTFICEAVAAELGVPVITLKNIRSKWFGETDKIFERLERLLECFHKIVIFVDEADTQFGSIEGGHETERRLTGKIQAMMSDVRLKGQIVWFLMTARIHLLSPDIRRPGRMDLIIPILDPEGDDRREFLAWVGESLPNTSPNLPADTKKLASIELLDRLIPQNASAAMFAMIRARIKRCADYEEVKAAVHDMVLPDIAEAREYQTLQAKVNCTRKSLLFDEEMLAKMEDTHFEETRKGWREQIQKLERKGIA